MMTVRMFKIGCSINFLDDSYPTIWRQKRVKSSLHKFLKTYHLGAITNTSFSTLLHINFYSFLAKDDAQNDIGGDTVLHHF